MADLSRVAWNGKRISCCAFTDSALVLPESMKTEHSSKHNLYLPDEEYSKLRKLRAVPYKDVEDINNGDRYEWYQYGSDKYGRCMYCAKTGIMRTQSMGEFYESSVVD